MLRLNFNNETKTIQQPQGREIIRMKLAPVSDVSKSRYQIILYYAQGSCKRILFGGKNPKYFVDHKDRKRRNATINQLEVMKRKNINPNLINYQKDFNKAQFYCYHLLNRFDNLEFAFQYLIKHMQEEFGQCYGMSYKLVLPEEKEIEPEGIFGLMK